MNWWFGRKSVTVERGFVPSFLLGEESDKGFVRGYAAQLDEVFGRNPVGQRSVRLIAGMIGGLPLFAADAHDDFVKLVRQPGLLEQVAAAMLLHGNAYVQLIFDGHGRPSELHALRPERVSIATDATGWPAAYVYRTANRAVRISARDARGRRQVAHLRSLNPSDDHYGLGCLPAAIAAASIHNRASRWNKALLDNAARPSGALSYEPGDGATLQSEQYERLKCELAEQFSGSGNAGRPLLLEGGLKWQALSMSPADMDFVALKEGAARDIALAFGMPPVLVGLPGDATYANSREAGRALYRHTVLPLANRILTGLAAMLSDHAAGSVAFEIDTDQLTELSEDRARLWAQAAGADCLSRDEKRALLGYAPEGGE
jgi:HK97 family phage portal protein